MFCQPRPIRHGTGTVLENELLAESTYRLALDVEGDVPSIKPGQFLMLRLPNRSDPLLGRPLAVYRTTPTPTGTTLEVVYLVVGKMTHRLAAVPPGDRLDFWAPLGNGFPPFREEEHVIMVAGGIGQTPFLMLAPTLCRRTLLYGVRNAVRAACIDDFQRIGVDVHVATDDGSQGYHGPVTDLIDRVYRPGEPTRLLCCGPHPMLRAAFQVARKLDLPCDVSLETPMSCGLGICFGCVVPYRVDDNIQDDQATWDYRRTCVDGPVFDAYRLRWD